MSSATLSHRADIRTRRRKAARSTRIVRRNIRSAAVAHGYSLPQLAKATRIPLVRLIALGLHVGRQMTVPEMTSLMIATDLDVARLFAGTQEVTA